MIDAEGGRDRPSPSPGFEVDLPTLSVRFERGIEGSESDASIDPRASSTSEYDASEELEEEEGRDDCEVELRSEGSESSEGSEGYDSNGGEGRGSLGGNCGTAGKGAE